MADTATARQGETKSRSADLKLEVVIIPVSDVDRAKRFYGGLGWRLDADFVDGDTFRVVQFTPPGSPGSIHFGKGLTSATPGSQRGSISSSPTSRRRAPSSSPRRRCRARCSIATRSAAPASAARIRSGAATFVRHVQGSGRQ